MVRKILAQILAAFTPSTLPKDVHCVDVDPIPCEYQPYREILTGVNNLDR